MSETDKIKWTSAKIGTEKYRTEIVLDNHTLIADEPVDNGGQDTGPGPGDFLRISLASCTAITLRMYADRKGYDVDNIEVKVYTEEAEGKTIFHRRIYVTGNIDNVIQLKMLQIANACPIHKVLTNPIEVLTQML